MIGLPDDMPQAEVFELWPEHAEPVRIFLACDDQWRTIGDGVLGLDLSVVFQMMDLYDVENRRAVMEDVRIIASRARTLLNDRGEG